MSRYSIITAHLDDFEFGMGGTASSLCKDHEVQLVVLCKGDRPGSEHVSNPRRDACLSNCSELGIEPVLYEYSDTKLDLVGQTELCNIVYKHVCEFKPEGVYTHYSDDIHRDHQIISNVSRVACRMRRDSSVNQLLEFSIPGSTEWSHNARQFNVYKDVTSVYDHKKRMMLKYCTEVRESPDPISLEMIEARDKYNGSICGSFYAESFNLVFMR